MERDTIAEGYRLVVWRPLPKTLIYNGRYTVIYDWELLQMLIKDWRAQGMSREEVIDLIFTDSRPIN